MSTNPRAASLSETTPRPFEGMPPAWRAEVVNGLRGTPKSLPSKLFYDRLGSQLFDTICELPEYYPTRTELRLLESHGTAMAERLGADTVLLELGTGSGTKTRLLLDQLREPVAYVPVDIAVEALAATCHELEARYPMLKLLPLATDFSRPFELPAELRGQRAVAYFPGSTIGNFPETEAEALLERLARMARGLLLGFDLKKDPARLHAAYNDAAGVTARFNLNLLTRLNRELRANFDLEGFFHYAPYNPFAGRIEMLLVSRRAQQVELGGEAFSFAEGEALVTEWSAKYTVDEMSNLAARAGWRLVETWADDERLFAVAYFEVGR